MSDDERRAKPDIGKMVADMTQGLELASRVDDVAAEVRVLSDRFAEHTRADEEDKKQILAELDDIPDRTAEKVVRALRRRPDDTPAPTATPRPRVSRELAARAAAPTETSSADLTVFPPPPPTAPPAQEAGGEPTVIDNIADVGKGLGLTIKGSSGLWKRTPLAVKVVVGGALTGVAAFLLSHMGCAGLAQKLDIKIDIPARDLGTPHDLVAEKRPAPPPPPREEKPRKPGKPKPKPSDGDAQVDPLRQPEERRHLDCQPGPRPLNPLLCPRDARPRPPGEW